MRNLVSFKDWLVIESHGLDLQELTLRGISAAMAVMIIHRESNRMKQLLGPIPQEQFHERKLEAIAAALNALNTKTTAMAALTFSGERRR